MPSPPPTPDDPVHAADVINSQEQPSPGWRRVAAFGVDYGLVVIYLGFLGLVGVLGRAIGALPTDITTPAGRVVGQLVAVAVLTLPVTAWFAGWEASPSAATPGKRLLSLRVVTTGGDRVAWPRSLPGDGAEAHHPLGACAYRGVEPARVAG
jgi:hypothetical protein